MFQALEASRGFWAARLDGFQITDALQLVHMVRRSQTIRVRTEFGEEGLVHMKDGEVIHAVLEELEGEKAFFEIVALEGGEIESLPLPEELPTSIQRPIAALILEGMRLKDEAASARKREPRKTGMAPGIGVAANESLVPQSEPAQHGAAPASDKPAVNTGGQGGAGTLSGGDFYRLVDEGFVLYRGGDLPAARERWEKALVLRPHDRAEAARSQAERALTESEAVTGFLVGLFEASDPQESGGREVTAQDILRRGTARRGVIYN